MTMTDPVADMLTRIRNAARADIRRVDIPASKLKRKIAELLLENNFIRAVDFIDDGLQGILRVRLRFTPDGKSVIKGLQKLSRPGLRVYMGKKDLLKGSQRPGVVVLSTSSGILTQKDALEKSLGGEALFRIW
jgi:small subunit ribosomal protein S8